MGRLGIDNADGIGERRGKSRAGGTIRLAFPGRLRENQVTGDEPLGFIMIYDEEEPPGSERLLKEESGLLAFHTEAIVMIAATKELIEEGARHGVLGPHVFGGANGIGVGVGVQIDPDLSTFESPPDVEREGKPRLVALNGRLEAVCEKGVTRFCLPRRRRRGREGHAY